MVIDNFDFKRVAVLPQKTDSPLIIYANAVLTRSPTLQFFQPVSRRDSQVVQTRGGVNRDEFPQHQTMEGDWETTNRFTAKQPKC